MNKKVFEVAIIGGGPAAMSAALYLSRFKRDIAIIPGWNFGGQIANTTTIENFLGTVDYSAPRLMIDMDKHFNKEFEGEIVYGFVNDIHFEENVRIEVPGQEDILSKVVLVATGSNPKKLKIKGEDDFAARGVSYCATCDASLYEGKNVAIVGGGETAFEDADLLSKYAKKVTLIHRTNKFRASPKAIERVIGNPKIEIMSHTTVKEIQGDTKVSSLLLDYQGINLDLSMDGIFVAIGQEPNTNFLEKDKDRFLIDGYIFVNGLQHLSEDRLFAAGDVRFGAHKQIAIAVGEGATAAININSYLNF